MDCHFADKRKTLALDIYSEATLAVTRSRHEAARKQLAYSIDPSAARIEEKQTQAPALASTF